MAERVDEPEAEGASEVGVGPISPAAAMAIGARRQRAGAKPDPKLDAFLDRQSKLTELQTEHLHEQRELMLSRLRLGRWKDRVTLALQAMTAVVGLAVAAAVGVMAWQAHEDHGLSIAPFSVPPDLAARGLTGQVVAARVLDRLAQLQADTVSARPASSYANDWGDEIKVEIPETGVSIGELNRWLREWLGSETRVTGEVVHTSAGLEVTARAGGSAGLTAQGAEADLDGLIAQAAEAVYAQTQPYRYAVYLASHSRQAEATKWFGRLAQSGPPADRPWAYAGWASILQAEGHHYDAIRMAQAAMALNPRLEPAYETFGVSSDVVGWWRTGIYMPRKELGLVRSGTALGLLRDQIAERMRFLDAVDAFYQSDYLTSARGLRAVDAFDLEGRLAGYTPRHLRARALALMHEVTAAGPLEAGPLDTNSYQAIATGGATLGNWSDVARRLEQGRSDPGLAGDAQMTVVQPLLAEAYAHLGRLQEAKALVASTPPDCYRCLIARAEIAGIARDWATADRWWAELGRQNPDRPPAPAGWAAALLARGDLNGAIAKAEVGHKLSPDFADPLQVWGEALLRKGDYAGAAARFAEADARAPRWGRNHVLWGEALMLSGHYREARAQYQAASGMDLSQPDRAALEVLLARTASGSLRG
jgi:tetratricopeptide (TPR) repeat protein